MSISTRARRSSIWSSSRERRRAFCHGSPQLAGEYLSSDGEAAEAHAAFDRALAIDPLYANAMLQHAYAYSVTSDEASTLGSIERCLAIAPNASGCIELHGLSEMLRGSCEAFEATARKRLAIEPGSPNGLGHLELARVSMGGSIGSIADLERQRIERRPPARRALDRIDQQIAMAIYDGDFVVALSEAHEAEALEAPRSSESDHKSWEQTLVVALEVGDVTEASRAARFILDRRPTWIRDAGAEMGMVAATAARRLGILDAKAFAELRARTVEATIGFYAKAYRPMVWVQAYATPATTRGDAEEALDALPRFSPLPSDYLTWGDPSIEGALGTVYALAEHYDEAIVHLEADAKRCDALFHPYARPIEWHLLGVSREAKGDKLGACAAYAKVLERWGHAKPRSITADDARKRSKALGCSG